MTNQAELVNRARQGNKTALEELLASIQGMIYSLCCRYCNNSQEAEDLCQEILIKIVSRLPAFRGEAAFSTWVYRVAVNTLWDNWRKKKVHTLPLEKENEDGKRDIPYSAPGNEPAAVVERKERIAQLHQALALLPEEQRLVIILRDIQGLSYNEISLVLQLEEGTVKSRLNRGRNRLREILLSGNFFSELQV